MSAKSSLEPLLTTTALASFDLLVLPFIEQHHRGEEITERRFRRYRGIARHFLIWLSLEGIPLETVGSTAIARFLQHECECCEGAPSPAGIRRWTKRRAAAPLMEFVRFLERAGKIETPGELDENLQLLDAFLERLRIDGYATHTIDLHRRGGAGLIAWLHFSRIRLRDLDADAYARFQKREFICTIPGVFYGQRTHSPHGYYEREIRKFLEHLAAIGRIAPLQPAPEEEVLHELLERFSIWLDRHRGVCSGTIRSYVNLIAAILPGLGEDPAAYDAVLVRRVLFEAIEHRTTAYAQTLTTAMRMYLRFLVSEGCITAALVEAVPTVPQWRLSDLPRYIPAEDIERAIASCGDSAVGVRDRAILLLLARLALRAGDIADLRLGDIDWERAEIRVSGKSRRETVLPLPQDAGDALHAYIATVRPDTDEEKVFFCVNAPCRPFPRSENVGHVARAALDRAGIATFANKGRGAHVFRHSQATGLLRSGATLDVIQSLLRHASRDTTLIYAKTDAVMLQEIAQPWIGGVEG
ncbi:MAG: tyrosine-type recombinase/integrase [Rhodospirillaceae bacterium]|nr:tyrosine-type recombinase/integrase [Rhodospirillaceae bacterium]